MMNDKQTLKYKSYEGSVEVSVEDQCLYGEILFIRDTVLYHAANVADISTAFEEAVDQYLADCIALDRQPNKPYSGTFNVRIGPLRHQALASYAYRKSSSINSVLCEAIDLLLNSLNDRDLASTYTAAPMTVRLDGGDRWKANMLRVVQ